MPISDDGALTHFSWHPKSNKTIRIHKKESDFHCFRLRQHLSTIYFHRKKRAQLMPKVILQYKMHAIKNAQRYFWWTPSFFKVEEQTFLKSYKNLLLRTCYCYYCRRQGMAFQDVTFYLRVRQQKHDPVLFS